MQGSSISEAAKCRLEKLCAKAVPLVPENMRDKWLHYLKTHLDNYISVLSRLAPPESCGKLLEVGCVPGHLTLLLADLGYNISCVDIDPNRISSLLSAHSIKVHKVDIETERLPFEDGSFSVVLFTEILEHLRVHPIFALREVARVTKTGGKIILSVPNITPRHRWKFFTGRDYQGDIVEAFEQLENVGHMGHVRLYSAREIQRILMYVGYTDLKFSREGRVKGSIFWQLFFPWRDYFRGVLYCVATKRRRV
ncbi:MAG: class I SAM-dependent methyltransferase [Sedimentisphaerales bacterium]|jgi:SAM-dependent methyltransferase